MPETTPTPIFSPVFLDLASACETTAAFPSGSGIEADCLPSIGDYLGAIEKLLASVYETQQTLAIAQSITLKQLAGSEGIAMRAIDQAISNGTKRAGTPEPATQIQRLNNIAGAVNQIIDVQSHSVEDANHIQHLTQ